jgi:L-asparaginase
VGVESDKFARKMVLKHFQPKFHNVVQSMKKKVKSLGTGTVGCLDQNGKIAVATSTGGKGFEVPGL